MISAFIVGKPIQIITSLNIIKQYNIKYDMHVFNAFYLSEETCKKLTIIYPENNFLFHKNRFSAIMSVIKTGYSSVFIDADIGIRAFLRLSLIKIIRPATKIFVYEEGIGSYRNDFYYGIKRKIFELFGIGVYYGGCIFVKNIFLYKAQMYANIFNKSKKAIAINQSYESFVISELNNLVNVFGMRDCELNQTKDSKCIVYLTNWEININDLNRISTYNGIKYLKPHPHIRENLNNITDKFIVIANSIPAEVLILRLLSEYELIQVFHYGSTSADYISNIRVNFVDLR